MNASNEPRKTGIYLLLLSLQILGMITFVWQTLPEFRQVAINPGEQLPRDGWSDLVSFSLLCVMQTAFWCRVLWVPIPFRHPNLVLNHVFLFLGNSVSSLAARYSASPSSGTSPSLIAASTFS